MIEICLKRRNELVKRMNEQIEKYSYNTSSFQY